jgi:hypothetical protein
MTDPETRQMVEVLANTLPDDMIDRPETEIAEYLCQMCALANYQVSAMNRHLFSIIGLAKANAGRMPERVF